MNTYMVSPNICNGQSQLRVIAGAAKGRILSHKYVESIVSTWIQMLPAMSACFVSYVRSADTCQSPWMLICKRPFYMYKSIPSASSGRSNNFYPRVSQVFREARFDTDHKTTKHVHLQTWLHNAPMSFNFTRIFLLKPCSLRSLLLPGDLSSTLRC